MQNAGDGAGCHTIVPHVLQSLAQFAPTPLGVLLAQFHDTLFHRSIGLAGTGSGASGTIFQAGAPFQFVARKPFVGGLGADAVASAQIAPIDALLLGQQDKFLS
jgi:hypothetical protein